MTAILALGGMVLLLGFMASSQEERTAARIRARKSGRIAALVACCLWLGVGLIHWFSH